jgi:hypothetical protein
MPANTGKVSLYTLGEAQQFRDLTFFESLDQFISRVGKVEVGRAKKLVFKPARGPDPAAVLVWVGLNDYNPAAVVSSLCRSQLTAIIVAEQSLYDTSVGHAIARNCLESGSSAFVRTSEELTVPWWERFIPRVVRSPPEHYARIGLDGCQLSKESRVFLALRYAPERRTLYEESLIVAVRALGLTPVVVDDLVPAQGGVSHNIQLQMHECGLVLALIDKPEDMGVVEREIEWAATQNKPIHYLLPETSNLDEDYLQMGKRIPIKFKDKDPIDLAYRLHYGLRRSLTWL